MTHVITQSCCNDASCVAVCPVNCIHPTPEEPDYMSAEMLYIDPGTCIDCGACIDVCPVGAISPDFELEDGDVFFQQLNALYYQLPEHQDYDQAPAKPRAKRFTVESAQTLRAAIVGSGPSAMYAAEELLSHRGFDAEVNVFERLPVPWGLARHGVAPDHQATKSVTALFAATARRKGVAMHLNVDIGRDLTLNELLQYHHAVIWAGGAPHDRRLGLEGEDLRGSYAATDFVAWYNGHPYAADRSFDLTAERAVVAGNGNVALDVARILATPVDVLQRTDIAPHSLAALAQSNLSEVVVLGRRGPAQAAFSVPELVGLERNRSFNIAVEMSDFAEQGATDGSALTSQARVKLDLLHRLAASPVDERKRTIRLRFLAAPVAVLGEEAVRGLRVARTRLVPADHGVVAQPTGEQYDLECGLVLRSVGYRGAPAADLPFDEATGVITNDRGRVHAPESGEPLPGRYVTGWIKRGPTGVIGTNKKCSQETVEALVQDYAAGRLTAPPYSQEDLGELIRTKQLEVLDFDDWRRLDKHERELGREQHRVRTKLVTTREILARAQALRR